MTDCLFLGPECASQLAHEQPVRWLREGDECIQASLAECAQELAGKPVALILPVEVVSSFLVTLPATKSRWLRQALPFAVEEMLAEDVESFHLAMGEQLPDQRYRVLAINRALLSGWLAQLDELDVQVAAIHVDADLLPLDGAQALLLDGRGLLGGDCELRMAFAPHDWPQLQALCEQPLLRADEAAPYQLLAAGRGRAINLAQGELAPRTDNLAWAIWRPVAILLGAWLVLHLGFSLFQALYYERQADHFAQSSLTLYKELFPEDRRIVNLRAQFAEHLKAGTQSSGGFISLIQAASASLAHKDSAVSVAQLDYSQSRGDLALQVKAKDFAEVEKLRQQLAESGLEVQMGSASREDDGITARVILGGAQ